MSWGVNPLAGCGTARCCSRLYFGDDNDDQAVRSNLGKARGVWGRLARVMRAENASPRVCGMFYKATVQAVLLYGSETWNLSPAMLRCLESFHLRAARRMTGLMPRKEADGSYTYPEAEGVLKKAGLHTIREYVEVRRNTIMKFVSDRPIYELCREAERKRGTGNRQYWWEQSFDLEELASDSADTESVVAGSEEGEEDR